MYCFSLGWTIELSREVNWNVFLGIGSMFTPTHSSTISPESITLLPNTKTYLSFVAEKYEFLKTRGYFSSKQYCEDDIEFTDTVACQKKCMLRNGSFNYHLLINGLIQAPSFYDGTLNSFRRNMKSCKNWASYFCTIAC